MKKILFSMMVTAGLVSCGSQQEVPYAVISGKLATPQKETLKLVTGRQLIKEIAIGADGAFRDTIREMGNKRYYYLINNQQALSLYLENGTNLVLNIPKEMREAQVTGKGAENIQFLQEKSAFLRQNLSVKDTALFGKNPQDFKIQATSVLDNLRKTLKDKKLGAKFTSYEENWLHYYYIQLLEDYPRYHAVVSGIMPDVPQGYNPEKEKINYDQADLYDNVSTYQTLVQNRLYELYPKHNDKGQIQRIIDEGKKLKSENIRLEIARVLVSFLKIDGENNELIYSYINDYITDAKFKDEVKNTYENSKKLTKGAVAPTFTYENYKGGETSLESLKGKVVYIDVWATWCMPCLQEIPALLGLEQKFHGKDVAFVSISIDDEKDRERWKQLIEKKQLKGIQLIADKAWKSKIVEDYVIKGIPRFILIDKDGKMVKADAPRPSDPATADLIEGLL